jgi:hypothetical protein
MGKNRFVKTGAVRYDLPDGEDWIEIKERLNFGEQQRLAGGALGRATGILSGNVEVPFDFEQYEILRMLLWLVDWSFVSYSADGKPGKPIRITKDALTNLDSDTATEISAIIVRHIEAQEAEKKVTDGGSEPIST